MKCLVLSWYPHSDPLRRLPAKLRVCERSVRSNVLTGRKFIRCPVEVALVSPIFFSYIQFYLEVTVFGFHALG